MPLNLRGAGSGGSARRPWTAPKEGAVSVAKTRGLSATASGTPLPPATPARIRWKVSAAYSREHDGHRSARRLPHRTNVTPPGSSAEAYWRTTSPLVRSTVTELPTSRTGLLQNPTRAAVDAHSSRSADRSRSNTWAWVPASVPGRPAQSGLRAPASTTASQTSLTFARVMSATPFPGGCAG